MTSAYRFPISRWRIAVQNLAWGFLQPLAGAFTVRYGFRAIMLAGCASVHRRPVADGRRAGDVLSVMLGAGVLIGMSLACTAAAIAMSVAARAVPATVRSTVLGMVSAAGSLGALMAAPIGTDPESGLRLAHRPCRLCHPVAGAAAGGLVRRQGRQDSAAATGGRRDRQQLGRGGGEGRVRQRLVRGDDVRRISSAACSSSSSPRICRPISRSAAWIRC